MTKLMLEDVKDAALFYSGENADTVLKQWREDLSQMFRFDDAVEGREVLPIRFKALLDDGYGDASAVTFNLCTPRNYMGLPDSGVIHLALRSVVEILGDQLVGLLHFNNQSVEWMNEPGLQKFKSLSVFKKKVNLITVDAYLRGADGYEAFESVYAVELEDLDNPLTALSCTEIYAGERLTSSESEARDLFCDPIIKYLAVQSDEHRIALEDAIDRFKGVLANQMHESVTGKVRTTVSIINEE